MKLPTINTRLLTPPVHPDLDVQKKQVKAQTQAASASGGGSGGRAAAAPAAGTTWYDVLEPLTPVTAQEPEFDPFLRQTSAYYQPATVDFTPLDRDTLASLLSEWLRPAYDRAIAQRREATRTYNANLDADAWARGVGRSSYVSDVKGRNYGDEARDIGTLEASYGAVLAEHLYDAMQSQSERKQAVDVFNAEQINAARQNAFDAAAKLYQAAQSAAFERARIDLDQQGLNLKEQELQLEQLGLNLQNKQAAAALAQKSGHSGGGGKSTKATTSAAVSAPTASVRSTQKSAITTAPVYQAVQTTTPETVERVLSRLSGSEREKLYAAQTPKTAKMLVEMTKTVGKTGMNKLTQRYASVK